MNRESGEAGTGCALDVGPRASAPEWGVSQSAELISRVQGGLLERPALSDGSIITTLEGILTLSLSISLSQHYNMYFFKCWASAHGVYSLTVAGF